MQDFRKILITKKSELLGRIYNSSQYAGVALDQDVQEEALHVQNDEVLQSLDVEVRHELHLIDRSLERLEHGIYTICSACHKPISEARLRANPFAEMCRDCAAK